MKNDSQVGEGGAPEGLLEIALNWSQASMQLYGTFARDLRSMFGDAEEAYTRTPGTYVPDKYKPKGPTKAIRKKPKF